MGATIRSGERGANLDSQSGSNQEVVSDAELDENEIKEIRKRLRKDLNESRGNLINQMFGKRYNLESKKIKENEMKECSDECRSKFRFQLFGKCYLKNENDSASQLILQEAYGKNDEVDARAEQPKLDRGDDDQYERRRENGLSPELRGDRSVHVFDEGQFESVRNEIRISSEECAERCRKYDWSMRKFI